MPNALRPNRAVYLLNLHHESQNHILVRGLNLAVEPTEPFWRSKFLSAQINHHVRERVGVDGRMGEACEIFDGFSALRVYGTEEGLLNLGRFFRAKPSRVKVLLGKAVLWS